MSEETGAAYVDLASVLAHHARRRGHRVAVDSVAQGVSLTFRELEAATNQVAWLLADRGVRPGDRVSVLSDNCLELVVLFFGVQRAGAVVNPLNVEVSGKNVGQILGDMEPRLAFWHRAVSAEVRDVVESAGVDTIAFGDGADDLLARLGRYPASPPPPAPASDDVAIIDYTSGTTARPKGVCITHGAYFAWGRSMMERLEMSQTDRILECRALSWASPQALSIGPALQAGATLVLGSRFSQRQYFEWIRDRRITIAAGVPTIVSMLLERPLDVSGSDVPALRFITSSSAPLPVETHLEFERRYRIPLLQGAGMTEAGFIAANPPAARRLGSIGPAVRHLTARFVGESGAECGPGEEGELVVGGRQMASAYLTGPRTLVPIPGDGFRTGDLGHLDADGYLFITGRKKDVIIRGGVNIAPMEITAALLAHPGVAEAATIGVPDEVYGEAIVSCVVLRPQARVTVAQLARHCGTRLSAFKCPAEIMLIDALPTNERGKVARDALQAIWRRRSVAGAPAS